MATAKEIRSKISGIKNTQKITSAMEKVAASKLRKAQERMQRSRPYAQRIRQVISHIANGHPEYQHSFFTRATDPTRGLHYCLVRSRFVWGLEYQFI